MIELHQFAPAWGINISPFCLKVEVYLRLIKLPFLPVSTLPQKAPKRKLPFIVDGTLRIADSGHIIEYLKIKYGDPLDGRLTSRQNAIGHSIRCLCEESLYFVFLYSRWIDDGGLRISGSAFFDHLPIAARKIGPYLVRQSIRRTLYWQGYGRHSRDEIYTRGTTDLSALANLIGREKFIVGDEPTSVDACVYAFLVNIVRAPHDTPLKQLADQLPNFRAYLERVDALLIAGAKSDPQH